MPFVVTCPSCKSGLRVATRKSGLKISCPKCAQSLVAYGEGKVYAINPANAVPLTEYVPPASPASSGSRFSLAVLFLVLIAFPAAWIAAMQYRAEHNDEIVAALGKPTPTPPPVERPDAPKIEPKDEPVVVAKLDKTPESFKLPEMPPPKTGFKPPEPDETTMGVRKTAPKVTPLPPPVVQPPPPVVAKLDPTPMPPRFPPKVPPPPPFVPPPKPAKTPNELKVESIFDEIRRFPASSRVRNQQLQALVSGQLPRFGDEILDEYGQDGFNPFAAPEAELERFRAQYPLRVMAHELSQRLSKASQLSIRDTVKSPIDNKQKASVPNEQKPAALAILSLQEALDDAQAIAGQRDKEKSKRWQAHFDLALARVQARMVYLYEYDNLLAAIRTESLPALEAGERGWNFVSVPKVQTKEASVKDLAKQAKKTWERIISEYPNSPWALIADGEKDAPQGLEWVATKK